jgi:hypothetical protein
MLSTFNSMGLGNGYGPRIATSQVCWESESGFHSQQGEDFSLCPRPSLGATQHGSSSNTSGSYLGVCLVWIWDTDYPKVLCNFPWFLQGWWDN